MARAEQDVIREALRACWDEYHELMPDDLYEQVRSALGLLVFEVKVEGGARATTTCPDPDLSCSDVSPEQPSTHDAALGPETCAYCAMPDGYHGRHLVLEPRQYTTPMHQECMDDIARWGCE